METGVIKNKQVSAHSAWNNDHLQFGASRARLHLGSWPPGWKAQKNDPSPWLQIDLLQVRTVTAVATQGYGDEKEQGWVKTYVLMVSRDGERWNSYKEGGNQRVTNLTFHKIKQMKDRLKIAFTRASPPVRV